ncbi:MAG: type II toxin-antitoxin system RelE/ParE family toxin [Burkholderiaceae bacterium]
MFTVKQTPEFARWIGSLKDGMTRICLAKRLDKAQRGNLGDVGPVGEGVSEMREHFGAGWRMYYVQRGDVLVVMLGGGDKSTQTADIKQAIALAKTLQEKRA